MGSETKLLVRGLVKGRGTRLSARGLLEAHGMMDEATADAIGGPTLTEALGLGRAELVAFVGAGGKTGALLLLGEELVSRGRHVLTTTTTAMFRRQLAQAGPVLLGTDRRDAPDREPAPDADEIRRALADGGKAAVAAGPGETGKVRGFAPGAVDDLWAEGLADYLLVEADGARGLPFKAFAAHEPQVPATVTTVVVVAGLDALGAALADDHVHRADLLASRLGLALDTPLTTDVFVAGLRLQFDRLRELAAGCRLVVLLNKAESGETRTAGSDMARELLGGATCAEGDAGRAPRPERVLVGSLHERRFVVETCA